MNYVSITCRKKRPRIHDVKVHWPVLSMHSWCQYIFTHHPGILLGGHRRSNKAGWEMMLQTFWNRFRDIKPDHCVFSSSKPLARCIPFMTHGDEGVTHRWVPFMVQSWQPVISFLGPDHTAISGSPGFSINSVFIYVYFRGLSNFPHIYIYIYIYIYICIYICICSHLKSQVTKGFLLQSSPLLLHFSFSIQWREDPITTQPSVDWWNASTFQWGAPGIGLNKNR